MGRFLTVTTRNLDRSEWQGYFDRLSRSLPATEIELRIEALDLGDQIELGPKATLVGIDYDPHRDTLEVATESASHRVSNPKAVMVEESGDRLNSVAVVDPKGRQHLLILRQPGQLPPA